MTKKEKADYDLEYRKKNKKRIAEYQKQYRVDNADTLKENHHLYYLVNKKMIEERAARWRKANPEKVREYTRRSYRKNIKQKKKYSANYRKENKQKIKEDNAKYYIKNKPRIDKRNQEYNKKNPEVKQNYKRRRRSIEEDLPTTLTQEEWQVILDQHFHRCHYCGKKSDDLHQEHKIPVSKDGGYTAQNIVPSCKSCNSAKNVNDYKQFVKDSNDRLQLDMFDD